MRPSQFVLIAPLLIAIILTGCGSNTPPGDPSASFTVTETGITRNVETVFIDFDNFVQTPRLNIGTFNNNTSIQLLFIVPNGTIRNGSYELGGTFYPDDGDDTVTTRCSVDDGTLTFSRSRDVYGGSFELTTGPCDGLVEGPWTISGTFDNVEITENLEG
jgi:hypothetical protein